MRWLAFRIFNQRAEEEDLRFAIRESQAVQLIPFTGVTPVTGAPEALLGTLDFRGKTIKAFDLGSALGLGPGYLPQRARLLVVRQTRVSLPLAVAVQPELQEAGTVDAKTMKQLDIRALARIGQIRRGGGSD